MNKLYKATTSFAGKVCMAVNEERRLADSDAAGLLSCGYIRLVEETAPQTVPQQENNGDDTAVTENAENVTETAENAEETENSVEETAESVAETAKQSKGEKK